MRGIIPLCLLVKLEKTTGEKTRDIFSFVGGTSSGAVIAAGVAAGIAASEMLDTYLERSREIFTKRPWHLLKRIIFGWMYSTERLNHVIAQELKEAASWTLNDSPIDILITAKRVSDGMPFYFVKDSSHNSCQCGNVKLVDCVTASSAAPTYFYPWNIYLDSQKTQGIFTDGAIGVTGNPVYQTCVEAFYYSNNYTPENSVVISLGTGKFPQFTQPQWLGSWIEWILRELFNSPGEQQTEIVRRHFPELIFYRMDPDFKELDPTLTQEIGLDDVEKSSILRQYGEQFASLVDWEKILEEKDQMFKVKDENTMWYQYKKP